MRLGDGTGGRWTRRRRPVPQAQAPRGDRRPAARRGHPVHGRRRAVPVRDAGDPRPRAAPARDRRPARRRRARPDDDRRAVAARRARDPPASPGWRSFDRAPPASRRSTTIVDSGRVEVDQVGETAERRTPSPPPTVDADAGARGRSCASSSARIDELNPQTLREGPHTILERYLERTGQRARPDRRRHARGEADGRQHRELPALRGRLAGGATRTGTLAGFVDYLDAYQGAGGELPTSVELTEDVEGVRLMTLYQAKGLEFPIVFVPQLLDGRVADARGLERATSRGSCCARRSRGRHPHRGGAPAAVRGDDPGAGRLILTTHGGPGGGEGAVAVRRRAARGGRAEVDGRSTARTRGRRPTTLPTRPTRPRSRRWRWPGGSCRCRPRASGGWRCACGRASWSGSWKATDADRPGGGRRARRPSRPSWPTSGERAARRRRRGARRGPRPADLPRRSRSTAAPGANLLEVAPLPAHVQLLALDTYEACPLQYAFSYVYRIPPPDPPVGAFTFGSTAHAAFEAFTKERRERAGARRAAADPRGPRARSSATRWVPTGFGDRTTEEGYQRRVATLLDNFWRARSAASARRSHEELDFELTLEPGDGAPPVVIRGSIDRIDRLPSGGIEVIDYKTGKHERRRRASTRASSCRSTRWPAATPSASARRSG